MIFLFHWISGGGKRQSGGKREELQTQLVDREKEVKSLQAKLEASHKEVCLFKILYNGWWC